MTPSDLRPALTITTSGRISTTRALRMDPDCICFLLMLSSKSCANDSVIWSCLSPTRGVLLGCSVARSIGSTGCLKNGRWTSCPARSWSLSGEPQALGRQFHDTRHHLADTYSGGIQPHRVSGGLQGGDGAVLVPLVPGAYVTKKGVKVSS